MFKILLAGLPNSGKSTLFNLLTKGNAKVGNWHGITVKNLEKTVKINGDIFSVTDTPGIYSLKAYTLEEKVSLNAIKNQSGVIVFLSEAINLKKSLKIVKELIAMGKKVVLAINMLSELLKSGGKIDKTLLQKACPFPVVIGDFNKKEDASMLINAVKEYKIAPFKLDIELAETALSIPIYKECAFDKAVLQGVLAPVFIITLLALTLYLSFGKYGVGGLLSSLLSYLFNLFIPISENFIRSVGASEFIVNLVVEGVLGGILGVLTFLPQMATLSLILTVLERSGIMSRIAYLAEAVLYKTGLNGRAVFSALTGLGCSAVSVLSTGGLENDLVKKKAMLLGGGISCSAKIPVFLLLGASLKFPFLYIVCIYLVEVFIALFQLFLADKLLVKGERAPLIMEMPPYRLPSLKETLKALLKIVKQAIIKIGTVIFIISIAVYLLKSLSLGLEYIPNSPQFSILAVIGKTIVPILKPLGLGDWRIASALVSGVFAKEAIASTLIALYPKGINMELERLLPLTLFIMLYPPCVATLSAVLLETGKRFFVKYTLNFYAQAYLFSLALRLIILKPFLLIILAFLIAALVIYEKIHGRKKLKTKQISSFKVRRKAKLFNPTTPNSK